MRNPSDDSKSIDNKDENCLLNMQVTKRMRNPSDFIDKKYENVLLNLQVRKTMRNLSDGHESIDKKDKNCMLTQQKNNETA